MTGKRFLKSLHHELLGNLPSERLTKRFGTTGNCSMRRGRKKHRISSDNCGRPKLSPPLSSGTGMR